MHRTMRSLLAISLTLVAVLATGQFFQVSAKQAKILEFDTMVGVSQAFTGAQNPIRGVNGGGLPWDIGAARGELTAGGHLEVDVRGLVFAAGPNIGKNTVASFRAIVSCLRDDGSLTNITTDTFPATQGPASEGGGNAHIETDLTLPQLCLAPIIFVTSPGGAWFAVTGG